jgi:hypothetical protein
MTNVWDKLTKKIKLTRDGLEHRNWFIDLNEEPGDVAVADLFRPDCWRFVTTRRAHDRAPYLQMLGEGDTIRIIAGDDDFDICVTAALPGGILMTLRGSSTPWDELAEIEAEAVAARRAAAKEKAAELTGDMP